MTMNLLKTCNNIEIVILMFQTLSIFSKTTNYARAKFQKPCENGTRISLCDTHCHTNIPYWFY